jgi:hypothetical protein
MSVASVIRDEIARAWRTSASQHFLFCLRGGSNRAVGYRQGWADASLAAAARVRRYGSEALAAEIEEHGRLAGTQPPPRLADLAHPSAGWSRDR